MDIFKVCYIDHNGKKKWYDLTKYESYDDFIKVFEKDFPEGEAELVEGGVLADYVNSVVPEYWEIMDLDEDKLELLPHFLEILDLDNAIKKLEDESYAIYSSDYDGFLDDDEIVGYQLLEELGTKEIIDMAIKLNLEESIARLVGEALCNGSRIVKTDDPNVVILVD